MSSSREKQCALRALSTFVKVRTSTATTTADAPKEQENLAPAEKTVLYLAYGSNLAASTFQGTRKVKPIRAVNVLVPSLQLVFDLPGVPYMEPCFANTRLREGPSTSIASEKSHLLHSLDADTARLLQPVSDVRTADNLGWTKGLVGVVYEVTESDYAHIIATEGGGSSYADIEVDCYTLEKGSTSVPSLPSGPTFRAHTLFAASPEDRGSGKSRRDGYAEPSQRYLNLLITGANEHSLPPDYQSWLGQLRAYHITTNQQRAGKVFFLATWAPFILLLFGVQKLFVDDHGRLPKWLGNLGASLFANMWVSYDRVYKKVFGDGERTINDPYMAIEKR